MTGPSPLPRYALIVDDEVIIAEDLRRRLQKLGYGILGPVVTAEQAIACARERRPALLLMDVRLQGPVDGVDTAALLIKELDLPVLFVTGCSDEATMARIAQLPSAATLVKPFDDRELKLAVDLALARHEIHRLRASAAENLSFAWPDPVLEGLHSLCILGVDAGGVIQYLGVGARHMLGLDGTSVGRTTLDELFLDPSPGGLGRQIAAAASGDVGRIELQTRPGRASVRWVSLTLFPRSSMGILVAGEDVTERRLTARKQHALYTISEAAHGVQSLDDLYRSIHRSISEVLPAGNFYIALREDGKQVISYPYFVDEFDAPPAPSAGRHGLTEYVLRTGKPVLVSPERFQMLVESGEVESVGHPSVDWLGVPLQLDGRTFGVLVTQTYSEGTRYSDDDTQMLSFVSHQVAMAIDRIRKQQVLQQSEAELRGLFSSMDSLVMVIDGDGRYLSIAPTDPGLLVRPASEMVGKLLHEVFPRKEAEFFLDHIRSSIATHSRVEIEYPLRINGIERWFECTITPAGEDRVLYVAHDITSRRRMEQSLREARETTRGIFEHAAMGIARRTLDGRFSSINPALMRMYGYTEAEELLAEMTRRRGQLYKEQGRNSEIDALLRTNEEISDIESKVTRRDGSVFWISENIRRVMSSSGDPLYYIETVQDITSRKQAENELRLLANTVACAQDCFMLTDLEGHILFVNDAFVSTYGYASEDLLGRSPFALGGGGVSEEMLREAYLPSSGSWNGELTGRRSDGSEFPAEVWTSPVKDERGESVAFVTVARDISDRKRSEEVIRRNELRLRRITDTMLDMIVQIDNRGVCEYASPSIRNIMGYAIDDVIGRNLLELVHRSDRKRVTLVFARLLRTASSGTVEYRCGNAQGGWVWLESIINPLCDAPGKVSGFVVGSLDVTHRKRAEDTLRLNEARLETLVALNQMTDASADHIIEFALEEAVLLTRSSLGFLAFLDDDQEKITSEVWSHRMRELYGPETAGAPAASMIRRTVEERRPVIANGVPSGPMQQFTAWAEAGRSMSVPVFDGPRIVAVAGVAQKEDGYDASDARQFTLLMEGMWLLVQQQRSQANLRRSLEEKEVLLKEVHHRVKNNLQIISSLLSLQLGHVADAALGEILRESQNRIRSMALIHERLYRSGDLSRVDFGYYVRNLTSHLGRTYAGGGEPARVHVNVGSILLGVDLAIPCGLIVNELVTNAFRHAFVDGRTGEVTITMTQNELVYRLTVRDNGVGLPAGFEVRNTTSLGLQLVQTLTEQIDGVLEIQNAGGAEFSIVFKAP